MSEIRHELTAADRSVMSAFRAQLAAGPVTMTRALYDAIYEQVPPADGIAYTDAKFGGVPGVWCAPSARRTGAAMLYLHGGGFVYGSARAYRNFVGQIVARVGVPAFVADYRLAPENAFPAALIDVRAAYLDMASQFGGNVAVLGDSAGGGLALSLLRDEPLARCGVLLSPWIDLALTGVSVATKAAEDPILTRAALDAGARQYLGDHDRRDPRASPFYAARRRTPPVQVHVGTAEILLDDSLRLAAHDRVEVHVWEGMPHVFPSSVGMFEAARAALDLMAAFVRAELARSAE
jgi:acetyl esterase/lipase